MAVHAINESGVPVTSMVSIEDVLEPEDITIYRALSGGVTTANILHGSSNPIGGQCTVIKLRWGEGHAGSFTSKGLLLESSSRWEKIPNGTQKSCIQARGTA